MQMAINGIRAWHAANMLKSNERESLQGMTVYHINMFYLDLFLPFALNFLLYHFIVSAVSVTSHNWLLCFNFVSRLYNSYIFYCLVSFICIRCTALENIAVRRFINQ